MREGIGEDGIKGNGGLRREERSGGKGGVEGGGMMREGKGWRGMKRRGMMMKKMRMMRMMR
jgi:hypothetical protein